MTAHSATSVDLTTDWALMSDKLNSQLRIFNSIAYGDFIIKVGGYDQVNGRDVVEHNIIGTVTHTSVLSGQLDLGLCLAAPHSTCCLSNTTSWTPNADTRYLNLGLSSLTPSVQSDPVSMYRKGLALSAVDGSTGNMSPSDAALSSDYTGGGYTQ